MWEFFSELLRSAGFVAVIYVATSFGQFLAIRALWTRGTRLERENGELRARLEKEVAAQIEIVRREEAEKRATLRASLDAQIVDAHNERRSEAREYAAKLEMLQERRVQEAQAVVREVVENMAQTSQAAKETAAAVQTLERVVRRGEG